mmetsp:Transcript_53114/g.166865  ORF Transcript_53114/g.166865 Transcript_53114/m.166865 type:complete len:453 (-) Transcript_53114:986-2344(-)
MHKLRRRSRQELLRSALLVEAFERDQLLQYSLRALHSVVNVLGGPLVQRTLLARRPCLCWRGRCWRSSWLRAAPHFPQESGVGIRRLDTRDTGSAAEHQLRCRTDLQGSHGGQLGCPRRSLLLNELQNPADVLHHQLVERRQRLLEFSLPRFLLLPSLGLHALLLLEFGKEGLHPSGKPLLASLRRSSCKLLCLGLALQLHAVQVIALAAKLLELCASTPGTSPRHGEVLGLLAIHPELEVLPERTVKNQGGGVLLLQPACHLSNGSDGFQPLPRGLAPAEAAGAGGALRTRRQHLESVEETSHGELQVVLVLQETETFLGLLLHGLDLSLLLLQGLAELGLVGLAERGLLLPVAVDHLLQLSQLALVLRLDLRLLLVGHRAATAAAPASGACAREFLLQLLDLRVQTRDLRGFLVLRGGDLDGLCAVGISQGTHRLFVVAGGGGECRKHRA